MEAFDNPDRCIICGAPPLVVTDAQVDRIVEVVREAIRAVSA